MPKRSDRDAAGAPLLLPEVRVVEASAGSGKTHALAVRYLRLLMEPGEDLRAILAITFTNKATREMKGRILDLLKRLALDAFGGEEEKAELVARLSADAASAGARASGLVEGIVRNYHCFQVQTIDSFINVLLSGCASELDLSPGFRIARNSGDYLAWSIDRCIERAGRERGVRKEIRAFVAQYLHLDHRAHWFPRTDIIATVGALFSEHNLYGGRFVKYGAPPARAKRDLLEMLAELRACAPEGTHAGLVRALNALARNGEGRLDLDDLRSAYFLKDEFPMTRKREAPPECRALWRRIRKKIPEVAEAEARSLFDCYIELFELASGEFDARAREDDVVFLDELNRRARDLFASGRVGVPELYLRLATAFRHFLIDEFQDTSGLQWRNLEGMVGESLATGGSLFYVGDRKQAIYRFRGGDVGLFDRVAAELGDQAPVRRESLALNRRSRRAIVEFNNEVFSEENIRRFVAAVQPDDEEDRKMLRPEDIDGIAAVFRDARQTHLPGREPGCVGVEALEAAAGEDEGDAVRERLVALVRELGGRFDPGEIAVLARGNDDVERITAWLTEARIDAASDRTLSVAHNPLVKELVALLRFLDSPIDNLAFASFILGKIFAAAAGKSVEEMRGFLFSLQGKNASGGAGYFYRAFRDRYPDAWREHLEELFRNVGFVPLYELVADILQRFRVHRHFGEYQGFFMRFLELIREQEEECGDIASFLAYFDGAAGDDLFVRFPGVNAVRVMTIHKAKGLGFPAVVIPFLEFDRGGMGGGGRSRGGPPYGAIRRGEEISLLRLDKKYTRLSPRLRDDYREEYRRRVIDELNTVY
ncbi:MAG: UvrD-helicase domain-containing protein, partial [Chlamydiota bacterium]